MIMQRLTTFLKRVSQKSKEDLILPFAEYYIRSQNIKTVPGDRKYTSTTKYEKNICIVGNSYIKRVRRNIVSNSIADGNAYLKSFSGAKVRQINHFVELKLSEDKPDI